SLQRQQFFKSLFTSANTFRQDHLAHGRQSLIAKEHVFCSTEPNAFRAKLPSRLRVQRCIGVCSDTQTTKLIRPSHQFVEFTFERRLNRRYLAQKNSASRTINGDPLAFSNNGVLYCELLLSVVNVQSICAADTSLAHTTSNNSGVTRHTTSGSHDCLRGNHPVEIIGARFETDQNYLFTFARHFF